ncbi:MFS transporter [Streptomyces sp. NPDC101213]|uniref:MFS transporter n=1 Tax=Streptomyces sp. NPDC101213 TaxID=3366130 RepID=UPI0038008669
MLAVLRNRSYRHLFAAQVVALVGTGLATVALGLLAYDLAGPDAGSVLGTALAIKMAAYVTIAPAVGALADGLPRKALMLSADLTRAGVALLLPFVDQVWQVYVLVFVLQSASAAFTPAFQAVVPEVLPEERDYTRALSMSRLAYDLESLFSPALAAVLLSVITYDGLFTGTALGFLASAALVVSAVLPPARRVRAGDARARAAAGTRLFRTVPALRALLALDLAVAAASATVTVNTVVYVRGFLDLPTGAVPLALGAYGAGSMAVALVLPRLLDRVPDRTVMVRGAALLVVVFAALGALTGSGGAGGDWRWAALLALWAAFGAACAMVLTPTGRLIRRAAPAEARTAAFAAHFSLSHGCWLLTYPLAGLLGATAGLGWAVAALGSITLGAALAAVRLWPAPPPPPLPGLPAGHPHPARGRGVRPGRRRRHGTLTDGARARP